MMLRRCNRCNTYYLCSPRICLNDTPSLFLVEPDTGDILLDPPTGATGVTTGVTGVTFLDTNVLPIFDVNNHIRAIMIKITIIATTIPMITPVLGPFFTDTSSISLWNKSGTISKRCVLPHIIHRQVGG